MRTPDEIRSDLDGYRDIEEKALSVVAPDTAYRAGIHIEELKRELSDALDNGPTE